MDINKIEIALGKEILKEINILELEFNSKYNNKNHLLLIFEINKEKSKKIEDLLISERIELSLKGLGKNIFKGYLSDICLEELNSNKIIIRLEALDFTSLLDLEIKNRIYQDNSISYEDIIRDVLRESDLDYHISSVFKKKISGIIYQNETDWKFLVRLASKLNQAVFITNDGIILFGSDEITLKESI